MDSLGALSFALDRQLIAPKSVVDGDLTIVDASKRNRNFGLLRRSGPSILVKHGADEDRRAAVANEARVYRALHAVRGANALSPYLPAYHGYDDDEGTLVLEYVTNSRNLREHTLRTGRFSTAVAAALGDALARLHLHDVRSFAGEMRRVPWVLSVHRPTLPVFSGLSESNQQVIRIVQRYPEFRDHLDRLHDQWIATAPIHGDIKWDNCLVLPRHAPPVKLVDWELAGAGDPDWDIGSVFSAYLGFWQFFVPVAAGARAAASVQAARYPLEKMQPAMQAFWRSYARVKQFDEFEAGEHLLRAVRYTGARLAQTAYELMQTSPDLPGNVVCSLQLSLNILERPEQAARTLLGLP